jgi:hypothetical protein
MDMPKGFDELFGSFNKKDPKPKSGDSVAESIRKMDQMIKQKEQK